MRRELRTWALIGGWLGLLASATCTSPDSRGRTGSGGAAGDGDSGQGGGGQGGQAGGGQGGGGGGGQGGGGAAVPPFADDYNDPSAPPDAKSAFAGPDSADAAAKPKLVYPLAGAMLGRNIAGMNVQWRAGTGNALFHVHIKGANADVNLYAGSAACPAGKCQLKVPDEFWRKLARASAGRGEVAITVRGVPAAGGAVATSAATTVEFTPEDLNGGLYYWSTKLQGVMRVKLGETTPEPFLSPSTPNNPHGCVGCHSLSRDGCRLSFRYSVGDHHLGVVDARDATRNYLDPNQEYGMFSTWHPNNQRILTTRKEVLTLRDRDGKRIADVPRALIGPAGQDIATHPEWSPDGKSIALTRKSAGADFTWESLVTGDIVLLPYDGANDSFAQATVLVPQTGSEYHYYPVFSPDSKWVVFNTATTPDQSVTQVPGGLSAYDQRSARVRMVAASGGTPVELARATQGKNMNVSWPKFSPFAQGNLFFLVFSSKIDYGFVVEQASVMPAKGYGRPQLWVAAVDVSKSGDPSFAPFWLPFQLSTDGNHTGFWTTQIPGSTAGGSDCKDP